MRFKEIKVIITAIFTLATLSACSVNETKNEADMNTNTEIGTSIEVATETLNNTTDVTYPLVIKHAFGETIIEKKPERIATISWGNQDTPLALGIIPVGVSTGNYGVIDGSGLLPWTLTKFNELGEVNPTLFDDLAGLDYESISDSNPDVILAAYSGITEEEYALLSEIAPVVAYPEKPWQTFWRDQIILDATGMGMKTEGENLVQDLEKLINEKITTYPELQGKKAAFFYFSPTDLGSFYVYLPDDPRAAYLTDLGMQFPNSVLSLTDASSSFAISISAENADLLDDVELIITYGSPSLIESLQSDSLLSTIPAIKNGAVAIIEDGTPLAASGTPSALSIPATIDDYLKVISEAAAQIK